MFPAKNNCRLQHHSYCVIVLFASGSLAATQAQIIRFGRFSLHGFSQQTNNTYIWSLANRIGWLDGSDQSATPTPSIACTVSGGFCTAYLHAYEQSYHFYHFSRIQ
jgi:hypothetical protein